MSDVAQVALVVYPGEQGAMLKLLVVLWSSLAVSESYGTGDGCVSNGAKCCCSWSGCSDQVWQVVTFAAMVL